MGLVVVEDGITPTLMLITERLEDFTVPLTAILDEGLFSAQEQVYEGKGAAFGFPAWEPMAPATIAKGRDPATLLVESGRLLLSMTRGSEGNIFAVSPTEGVAGTNVTDPRNGFAYPSGQQRPGRAKRPARPFLLWYPERVSQYDVMMLDWISGEVAGHA
jgi:hypothetical protein